VREEGDLPELEKELENPPKDPYVLAAARLLEACDLNFLLIVMWGSRVIEQRKEWKNESKIREG
jgi:hypothetical protein